MTNTNVLLKILTVRTVLGWFETYEEILIMVDYSSLSLNLRRKHAKYNMLIASEEKFPFLLRVVGKPVDIVSVYFMPSLISSNTPCIFTF